MIKLSYISETTRDELEANANAEIELLKSEGNIIKSSRLRDVHTLECDGKTNIVATLEIEYEPEISII